MEVAAVGAGKFSVRVGGEDSGGGGAALIRLLVPPA